ncbi:MAG: FAD:protein FMN transferase [Bacteroidales bacterium]|nr:FAD:protein FMN transferase [Bacteroidales bacterium]
MDNTHHNKSVRFATTGRFFVATLAALLLVACTNNDKTVLTGETQGSYYTIAYYDPQHRDLQPAVDSILNLMDQTLSLWNDSSLLRHLNETGQGRINIELKTTFDHSQAIAAYTDGAFDCRVGRLVRAWGFSFKQRETLSQTEIDSLLTYSHGSVSLQNTDSGLVLVKQYPQTELDFNAIAQGETSDRIAQMLRERGINSFMVDVGGEIITGAPKPDGSLWTIGIERPASNRYDEQQVLLAIGVSNLSVVTSGNYRKYYEKDGVKYSHTIDPTTGRPVSHTLLSATVVSDSAWRADALATAFMVMGLDSAMRFIAAHPDDPDINRSFFIYSDQDGEYKTYATPEFEKLTTE